MCFSYIQLFLVEITFQICITNAPTEFLLLSLEMLFLHYVSFEKMCSNFKLNKRTKFNLHLQAVNK